MRKRTKSLLAIVTLIFSSLAMTTPANAADLSASQKATVTAVFKALASSNPNSINRSKRFLVKDSPAYLAVEMVQNYYSTERYFRSVTSNTALPLGGSVANAARGTYKVSKSSVALTTAAPGFSATHLNFKFRNGKLYTWSLKNGSANAVKLTTNLHELDTYTFSLANNLNAVYWGRGVQVNSGVVLVDSLGNKHFQLSIKNVAPGPKSFSATGGAYQSPNRTLQAASASPVGCFGAEQTVFFNATVGSDAVLISGSTGVLEVPISNGCAANDSSRIAVAINY